MDDDRRAQDSYIVKKMNSINFVGEIRQDLVSEKELRYESLT